LHDASAEDEPRTISARVSRAGSTTPVACAALTTAANRGRFLTAIFELWKNRALPSSSLPSPYSSSTSLLDLASDVPGE
jgi:hypothetical protein